MKPYLEQVGDCPDNTGIFILKSSCNQCCLLLYFSFNFFVYDNPSCQDSRLFWINHICINFVFIQLSSLQELLSSLQFHMMNSMHPYLFAPLCLFQHIFVLHLFLFFWLTPFLLQQEIETKPVAEYLAQPICPTEEINNRRTTPWAQPQANRLISVNFVNTVKLNIACYKHGDIINIGKDASLR